MKEMNGSSFNLTPHKICLCLLLTESLGPMGKRSSFNPEPLLRYVLHQIIVQSFPQILGFIFSINIE